MKVITTLILLTISYLTYGQSVHSDSNVDNKIIFIDTKESLNEQIKQFDGKIIYLDIWSTFCSPCIKQFKYKKELNDFFESSNIITFCLCVDKESNKDKWKNIIQNNSVTGYHVFINSKLIDEYKSGLYINKSDKYLGHMFPQFLIIGKNGNVLVKHAYSPKNRKKLIKQLRNYIN